MTNYSIKKLQREYLKAQLAAQPEGKRCSACWMTLCDCVVEDVTENPFLLVPNMNEVEYTDQNARKFA
jgi:hypothetical protein